MRRVSTITLFCTMLGAVGFAALQTQPTVATVATLRGIDVSFIAPAHGTTRLYMEGDTALLMYDRATRRTSVVARGEFWEPAISPAGDRVTYYRESENGNGYYIWTMPLNPATGMAAGPARRASMSQGDVPSFSPDGGLIAFGRDDSIPGQDLAIVPANGGPERILARFPRGIWSLAWHPDGKSIYFAQWDSNGPPPFRRGSRTASVVRVASAGGRPQVILQTTGGFILSPNGRLMLTASGQAGQQRHVISDSAGRKLAEFTLPAETQVEAWTGPTTILTSASLTPTIITTVSVADGRKRRVTDSTSDVIAPTWSPDGRRLAYLQWNGSKLDHVIMNADGSGKRTIPGHRTFVATPPGRGFEWMPDGSALLYNGDTALYVIDAATGRERKINAPGRAGSTSWYDSRSVLYARLLDSSNAGFRKELRVVTFDGRDRALREVTVSTNCPGCFNTIGDSVIVFGRHEGTSVASLRNGAAPRKLFPGDSTMRSNPTISHDGQWLVFRVVGTRSYDVLRVDGSGKRRIDVPADPVGDFSAIFSRDSRDLLFIGRDTVSRLMGVYRLPIASGEARKIVALDDAASASARDFSISPDGNTIAYLTRGQPATRLGEINIAALLPPALRR